MRAQFGDSHLELLAVLLMPCHVVRVLAEPFVFAAQILDRALEPFVFLVKLIATRHDPIIVVRREGR
jgi:hypothetical protein